MKLIKDLADDVVIERYNRIKKLNIRSSIYDISNKCNLRCKGCFFYSSGQDKVAEDETDITKWEQFVLKEKKRGVNNAILIGGEPALFPERIEVFYKHIPTFCATNGQIKLSVKKFPNLTISVSLWGNEEIEEELRGKKTFSTSLNNYQGDKRVYFLYTITPNNLDVIENVTQTIRDAGLKIHYQMFTNDEKVPGYEWTAKKKREVREIMDTMLEKYSDTVISSKYYHKVLTENKMLGKDFGWEECPSVSLENDNRKNTKNRLIGFQSYASDLKTIHRCCTSDSRICETCNDGAAKMSWVLVNKRKHMNTSKDFENWIEVAEMFARLYNYI
tara:strand:- start:418 stop:1410 length:993 start_codon:yes stop_codon:yes gene_type:complete